MLRRKWRSFDEARAFVRSLSISSRPAYRRWSKAGLRPKDIPSGPDLVYSEFKGWGDWLGTGTIAPKNVRRRSFEEAKRYARSLHFKTVKQWYSFCKTNEKPQDIPRQPAKSYDEWKNWSDWLGTPIRTWKRKRRSVFDAKITSK